MFIDIESLYHAHYLKLISPVKTYQKGPVAQFSATNERNVGLHHNDASMLHILLLLLRQVIIHSIVMDRNAAIVTIDTVIIHSYPMLAPRMR